MWYKYLIFACLVLLTGSIAKAEKQNQQQFSYDNYASVLSKHVDDKGMVNYKKLKAKSKKLNAFIASLSSLDPNSYDSWSEKEKIAFWLNAYNALTIKAIIDNYPIKSSFFRSLYYPKKSIRQIDGVWDEITFKVLGQKLTLGNIEHKILRKKFNEPRIHMAMVCAAKSCPYLRTEPYIGEKLDSQLDNQTQKFLSNPRKFRFDFKKRVLYISPIFKWFGDDFVSPGGTYIHPNQELSLEQIAILEFISKYLNDKDGDHLLRKKFEIKYMKYDWSLNEQ